MYVHEVIFDLMDLIDFRDFYNYPTFLSAGVSV